MDQFLRLIGEAVFHMGIPVGICWSVVRKMGGTPILGIILGLTLVSGQLLNAYAVATTPVDRIPHWDFGYFTVDMIGYQSQVLPAILAALTLVYLERFFKRLVPTVVQMIVVPFCSLVLAVCAAHFVLGPIGWAIDPHFGTMDDFDALVKAADAKGLKIMLDMVLCHTSDQHAWFQRALAGDADYQRYYILRDGRNKKCADDPGEPPTNWQCAFGGSAWQWEPRLGKWYLHLHDVSQPDLDWTNPTVRDELAKVVRFWKERGVAGFRFDVINLVAKPEVFADDTQGLGRRLFADGPHIHEYLQELIRSAGIGD